MFESKSLSGKPATLSDTTFSHLDFQENQHHNNVSHSKMWVKQLSFWTLYLGQWDYDSLGATISRFVLLFGWLVCAWKKAAFIEGKLYDRIFPLYPYTLKITKQLFRPVVIILALKRVCQRRSACDLTPFQMSTTVIRGSVQQMAVYHNSTAWSLPHHFIYLKDVLGISVS